MLTEEDEGVKKYLNSASLLQYAPKKDLEPKEDDFFARINFKKKEENRKNETKIEKKNPLISETLNNMFPPNNLRKMVINIFNMYPPPLQLGINLEIYLKL